MTLTGQHVPDTVTERENSMGRSEKVCVLETEEWYIAFILKDLLWIDAMTMLRKED